MLSPRFLHFLDFLAEWLAVSHPMRDFDRPDLDNSKTIARRAAVSSRAKAAANPQAGPFAIRLAANFRRRLSSFPIGTLRQWDGKKKLLRPRRPSFLGPRGLPLSYTRNDDGSFLLGVPVSGVWGGAVTGRPVPALPSDQLGGLEISAGECACFHWQIAGQTSINNLGGRFSWLAPGRVSRGGVSLPSEHWQRNRSTL